MTQQTKTATPKNTLRQTLALPPWALWWRQGVCLTRIEIRRNLFSWKALWIYSLAYIPTVIILVHALLDVHGASAIGEDTKVLAGIIQLYYLRLGVFFGCLGIFTRLIRGEMMERSLHFYLLSPVRREILLLAKFVAGSIAALLLFVSAILADFVLIYAPFRAAGSDYVFHGPGFGQLGTYIAIIVLACLGYGAVFLLLSMMFRNPIPGAMIVLGWEAINPILPSLLQRVSVAFYLHHLMPVVITAQGIFALLTVKTEPVSPGMATLGLLVLIAAVLFFSCIRMRTLEIRYTTE
jgi:ABC-type transport system involved in multi-copper enzyme maturation permease subunit